ncbi:hypothetical protein [Streptomyces sp. NPDC059122]|uniref:DUF7848 domain-containing protein n=1 Tax=Streptomyces sp. NPDC059122 TaxID=3346732 RepID=UPI0036AB0AF6
MTMPESSQQWALQLDPELGLRHVAKCIICGDFCVDTSSADEAQDWCRQHARDTGDDYFELTGIQYGTTVLVKHPSVHDTPPT